jgi:hypothetical protein
MDTNILSQCALGTRGDHSNMNLMNKGILQTTVLFCRLLLSLEAGKTIYDGFIQTVHLQTLYCYILEIDAIRNGLKASVV